MDYFDYDGSLLDTDLGLDFDSDYTPETYTYLEEQFNVSFEGGENSDGYKPAGKIYLERTISGSTDGFDHYTRHGNDYVKVGNDYIQIDKGRTVTINNIKYDTI